MVIEQAIFTSAQTDRSDGYQLVVASRGIVSEDRRELTVWGPSHDSLLTAGGEASSVGFFRLPSGSYCVSKTVAAGPEYSGRGGQRIYTHYLVVPPEALARFGNNPFAVLYAAIADALLRTGAAQTADELNRLGETAQQQLRRGAHQDIGTDAALAQQVTRLQGLSAQGAHGEEDDHVVARLVILIPGVMHQPVATGKDILPQRLEQDLLR